MPGRVSADGQFACVKPVENADDQGNGQGDAYSESMQCTARISAVAVLEQEHEPTGEADDDADQEERDDDFEHR